MSGTRTVGGRPLTADDEQARSKRVSEAEELDQIRTADRLDEVITDLNGGVFKGRIDHRTFRYSVEHVSRQQDVTFDREYVGCRLLIDYFPSNALHTVTKDEVERDIAFKYKFAASVNYKYFPIVEGSFNATELKNLLRV
jgi:hypothetical protein